MLLALLDLSLEAENALTHQTAQRDDCYHRTMNDGSRRVGRRLENVKHQGL